MKLSSGTLAVFSPVALTDESKAKVEEMGGKVGYLIALDMEHHIFLSEWARQYPDAKLVGPEGLQEKRAHSKDPKIGKEPFSVLFDKVRKRETRVSDEFDADFDYEFADGHGNEELVFLHRRDKVLIEADLLFNLPANEQYSRVPDGARQTEGIANRLFATIGAPSGDVKWLRRFNWYLLAKDRASLNDSLQRIEQWDFDTIIPCHGDVIEGNGKELFRRVFEWHLTAPKK